MEKKKALELSRRRLRRPMKDGDIIFTDEAAHEINALKQRKINLTDKDAPEITNWEIFSTSVLTIELCTNKSFLKVARFLSPRYDALTSYLSRVHFFIYSWTRR